MTALPYYEEPAPARRIAGVTVREILISLFKDIRVIAAAFVLVTLAGVAVSFLPSPKYEAQASVLVRMGRDYMMRSGLTSEALPAISSERIVTSEVDILRSPALMLETVQKLGPTRLYPDLEKVGPEPGGPLGWLDRNGVLNYLDALGLGLGQPVRDLLKAEPPRATPADLAADRFATAFRVIPGRESNTIFLTFQHPDRMVAQDALDILLKLYLERRKAIFSNMRADFVRMEARKVRDRLEAFDRQIEQFKVSNGIIDFPGQRTALLQQQTGVTTALLQAQNQLAEAERRFLGLKEMLDRISPDIKLYAENQTSRAADDARASLLALQMRERAMATRFSDSSQALQEIRQEIAEAQRLLRSRETPGHELVRTGTNPLFDQVRFDAIRADAERQAIVARISELEAQAEQLAGQLRDFDAKGVALAQLERERDVAAESYRVFARQGDEATVLEEFDRQNQTNVGVVQAPRTGPRPVDLQPLIIAAAVFIGLLAAVLTALVMELRRATFLTPEGLERSLGLPVLAAIPETVTS